MRRWSNETFISILINYQVREAFGNFYFLDFFHRNS